jgi:hypothetical protein
MLKMLGTWGFQPPKFLGDLTENMGKYNVLLRVIVAISRKSHGSKDYKVWGFL